MEDNFCKTLSQHQRHELRAFLESQTGFVVGNLMNDYVERVKRKLMSDDLSPEEVLREREKARGVKAVWQEIVYSSSMDQEEKRKRYADTFT
jgi:hypothetical protein